MNNLCSKIATAINESEQSRQAEFDAKFDEMQANFVAARKELPSGYALWKSSTRERSNGTVYAWEEIYKRGSGLIVLSTSFGARSGGDDTSVKPTYLYYSESRDRAWFVSTSKNRKYPDPTGLKALNLTTSMSIDDDSLPDVFNIKMTDPSTRTVKIDKVWFTASGFTDLKKKK